MFEIGWTEMLVIAVVMIVVVGPKDLPKMLRTFGRTTAKLRAMAGDFQKQFNDALKEAELDDVKKSVDSLRSLNPANEIKKQLNPFEKAAADVRAGLDTLKPKSQEPASAVVHPSEPLKNGAASLPGDDASPSQASLATASPSDVKAPVAPAEATASPPPKVKKPKAAKAPTEGSDKAKAKPKTAKPRTAKPKTETKPAKKAENPVTDESGTASRTNTEGSTT